MVCPSSLSLLITTLSTLLAAFNLSCQASKIKAFQTFDPKQNLFGFDFFTSLHLDSLSGAARLWVICSSWIFANSQLLFYVTEQDFFEGF